MIKILISSLLALSLSGQTIIINSFRFAGAGAATYLAEENFEGSGYELSWAETGTGTLDEDYATSPAPLVGSQSFRTAHTAQNGTTTHTFAGGAVATAYGYFIVHRVSNAGTEEIFSVRSGGSLRLRIAFTGAGGVRITHGSSASTTVTTYGTGTTVHVWWRYSQGTGADGIGQVWTSTTATKPADGSSDYTEVLNGTATSTVNQIVIGPNTTSTQEMIIDKVRVDDVAIGSNPT